jgi:Na+/glutamate symporter
MSFAGDFEEVLFHCLFYALKGMNLSDLFDAVVPVVLLVVVMVVAVGIVVSVAYEVIHALQEAY